MDWELRALLVTSCLWAILLSSGEGHGRNSTVIRADIAESGGTVVIHAVLSDLLAAGRVGEQVFRDLPAKERESILRTEAEGLAGKLRLVTDHVGEVVPLSVQVEMADLSAPERRWMGLDQQYLPVTIEYAFASPPESVTFLLEVMETTGAEPVHVQLMVRQQGELVLLPAELGNGLAVTKAFDWAGETEPIAERTSLASVACTWRNRPAGSILAIGGKNVEWRVFLPLRILYPEQEELAEAGLAELEKLLEQTFALHVGDLEPVREVTGLKVKRMTGHELETEAGRWPVWIEEFMAEFVMRVESDSPTVTVALECTLLESRLPALYTEIMAGKETPGLYILKDSAPVMVWRKTL